MIVFGFDGFGLHTNLPGLRLRASSGLKIFEKMLWTPNILRLNTINDLAQISSRKCYRNSGAWVNVTRISGLLRPILEGNILTYFQVV